MEAYAVVQKRRTGKDTVTWCASYKFDIKNRKVNLYGDAGGFCGSVNLEDQNFKELRIYNAKRPMDDPVDIFLPCFEIPASEDKQ